MLNFLRKLFVFSYFLYLIYKALEEPHSGYQQRNNLLFKYLKGEDVHGILVSNFNTDPLYYFVNLGLDILDLPF